MENNINEVVTDENSIVTYDNGEIEINVQVEKDTIWVTQKQLAFLFEVESNNITYHIKNIYKQKELDIFSTTRKIRVVQKEGNREVERNIDHYNLDIIISVGYRVNSFKATQFRQWATKVLKEYIYNGYAINSEKITHQRFKELENDVSSLK